jgi:hypothetical protein
MINIIQRILQHTLAVMFLSYASSYFKVVAAASRQWAWCCRITLFNVLCIHVLVQHYKMLQSFVQTLGSHAMYSHCCITLYNFMQRLAPYGRGRAQDELQLRPDVIYIYIYIYIYINTDRS